MGIQSFNVFVKNRFEKGKNNSSIKDGYKIPKEIYSDVNLSYFSGKTVAIDTYYFAYRLKSRAVSTIVDIMTYEFEGEKGWSQPEEKIICKTFYSNFISLIESFKRSNINLKFVWEGPPEPMKLDTKEKRMADYEKNIELAKKYRLIKEELSRYKKFLKMNNRASEKELDGLKTIIHHYGYDLLIPNLGDGERICSQLTRLPKDHPDYSYAVLSKDTDVYPYGANIIFSDISGHGSNIGNVKVKVSSLRDILDICFHEFNIPNYKVKFMLLRFLCTMTKNDFSEGIKGKKLGRLIKIFKEMYNGHEKDDIENFIKEICMNSSFLNGFTESEKEEKYETFIKIYHVFKRREEYTKIMGKKSERIVAMSEDELFDKFCEYSSSEEDIIETLVESF